MNPYYKDRWVTIYHGDCREILPQLDVKADLVLTDPPYELQPRGAGIASRRDYLKVIDDGMDVGFDMSLLDAYKNWFCFCAKAQLYELLGKAQQSNWMLLIWCKYNPTPLCHGTYLPDVEYIVHKYEIGRLFGEYKDKSRFYISGNNQNEFSHPAVKPISLIQKLITLGSEDNNLILDPFLGSGTTAYCAKKLNRRCIGIEIEEKYCEIAANRCRQEVMELKI